MTTEIERTARVMYCSLQAMRKAKKHPTMLRAFEEDLEKHLEEFRKAIKVREDVGQAFGELMGRIVSERDSLHGRLAAMTEERDQIQGRLHAIDHAYCEQTNLVTKQALEIDRFKIAAKVAGECIQDAQRVNRSYQIEIKSLRQQLDERDSTIAKLRDEGRQHLDDCRSAEKLSDDLDEKFRDSRSVIAQQELLIVSQRLAIADLYIAGRRANSAVATLQRLGYTDCGGQLWKPPLSKKPRFHDWCTSQACAECRARDGVQ